MIDPVPNPRRHLKSALRAQARSARASLDPAWRADASAAIRDHILALPEIARPSTHPSVALFASVGDEVDLRPLLARLIELTGSVLLPCVLRAERRIEFRRVASLERGFIPAFQSIPEPDPAAWPEVVEPAAMDLIIVPGLLFDSRGYRLGYGGGFYDRLLALPRSCRAVGVVFSPLLRAQPLPATAHDQPVDAIMTEQGLVEVI